MLGSVDQPDQALGRYASHFARLAARYDALRDDPSDHTICALVAAGDLAGESVVDIGCGTGRVTAALAEQYQAEVLGVDPSAEMVEIARARLRAHAGVVQGRAEQLPCSDQAFERAVAHLVVHLVDRRQALGEVHRALKPGGRFVICTVDPEFATEFWLADLFPSYPEIEQARFPALDVLSAELGEAGLLVTAIRPFPQQIICRRQRAMELLRGRFASSIALISETEYRAGLAHAEATLPDPVEAVLETQLLVAERR